MYHPHFSEEEKWYTWRTEVLLLKVPLLVRGKSGSLLLCSLLTECSELSYPHMTLWNVLAGMHFLVGTVLFFQLFGFLVFFGRLTL